MITVQKDDIYMEIDERVLSEHERLGWRVVDEMPENVAQIGVTMDVHNSVLAENAQLKAENEELKMRHAEFAESTAQTVAIEAYQALQAELETAQARIAELEAELTAAKANNPKGKKTTPAE